MKDVLMKEQFREFVNTTVNGLAAYHNVMVSCIMTTS